MEGDVDVDVDVDAETRWGCERGMGMGMGMRMRREDGGWKRGREEDDRKNTFTSGLSECVTMIRFPHFGGIAGGGQGCARQRSIKQWRVK